MLTMIGGMPIELNSGIKVYQPRLSAIRDIGYTTYNSYVSLFMMSTQTLLDTLGIPANPELLQMNPIRLILMLPGLSNTLIDALSFFLDNTIVQDENGELISEDGSIIQQEALYDIRSAIAKICCIESEESDEPVHGNAKAMAIYQKIQEGRKKKQHTKKKNTHDMEIDNLISAVSARSATYNLLNIWDLTVWQLYDQFARMNINDQYDIWAQKWAAWGQDDYDFSVWYKNSQSE